MAQKLKPTQKNIQSISQKLKDGEIVALPTETVYGLFGDATKDAVLEKIFALKKRPADNPLIVHIADFKDLQKVVSNCPDWVHELMGQFWPGPISFVLSKHRSISRAATAGLSTVSVRMSDNQTTRKVIRLAGVPLAGPSANLSGRPSPTKASHVMDDFSLSDISVLDGGDCKVGIESTVLLCKKNKGYILRPGSITREMLAKHASVPIVETLEIQKKQGVALSPGTRYKHYKPKARVLFVSKFPNKKSEKSWWCFYGTRSKKETKAVNEKNLYKIFREADDKKIQTIYILNNNEIQKRVALVNRIVKASE